MMRSVLLGCVLALCSAGVAHAQTADAIGKPLPRGDLDAGTVTVRVVEGEMSAPVTGVDVRLVVDGKERVALTDASGRATFPSLTPGATVKAVTAGASGDVESVEFQVPQNGGVSVLLSTVEWKGGAAGPMGGQPSPRMMAGQPRPEKNDPPGTVTVRISYNDTASFEGLADRPIVMVKYGSDGKVMQKVIETDAQGRAKFDDLDTSGHSAYYAMTMLPRDGRTDRTMSLPVLPNAEMGLRLMLSGEKRGSGEPAVDDLSRFAREPALPPGQVLVIFGGDTPSGGTVTLHEAAGGKQLADAEIRPGRPIPSTVKATVGAATTDATLAPGVVKARVVVAAGGQELGLPKAPVRVRTVGTITEVTGLTDDQGEVSITGAPVGVPLELVVDIQGQTFTGAPFTLAADHGATVAVSSTFELLALAETSFAGVPATPEGAYYAELKVKDQTYRSPPFQMAPERGVVVPIFVIEPRIQFAFQLDAFVDDEYLAVRGQFVLQNASFAPWAGPAGGYKVPAPVGATGLQIADEAKPFVSAEGDGFRLLRPVPPMGADFRAAFSIPTDGSVEWDLALPLGATQSSLAIRMTPGMEVTTPPKGVRGQPVTDPNSGFTWYAIQGIDIGANQRMVFEIHGLPRRPAWQRWARLATGLSVILLLALGVMFAAAQTGKPVPGGGATKQRRKRIEHLLDEIATHDRDGFNDLAAREKMMTELEQLYREDDRG